MVEVGSLSHTAEFLTPEVSPFFTVNCTVRYLFLLSVALEAVAPDNGGECNYKVIKGTEEKTLPCVAVFVNSAVVCPGLALGLVLDENEKSH